VADPGSGAQALFRARRMMFALADVESAGAGAIRKQLIEYGGFKPVIGRTYPLERIVEAYRYVRKPGERSAMS
jgi:hypothetical protein